MVLKSKSIINNIIGFSPSNSLISLKSKKKKEKKAILFMYHKKNFYLFEFLFAKKSNFY
jgi:hypothetical protein